MADSEGFTPYFFAVRNGSTKIMKLLSQRKSFNLLEEINADLIFNAASCQNVQVLEEIFCNSNEKTKEKALNELNTVSNLGSPLHGAVFSKDITCVKFLLQLDKINVNIRDQDGVTPLHVAIGLRNEYLVDLLIESGAEVDEEILNLTVVSEDNKLFEKFLLILNQKVDFEERKLELKGNDVSKIQEFDQSFSSVKEELENLKTQGNEKLKAGNILEAVEKYSSAQDKGENLVSRGEETLKSLYFPVFKESHGIKLKSLKELLAIILSNKSMALLSMKDPTKVNQAKDTAERAIVLNPDYHKAWHRLATCYMKLEMYADAAQKFYDVYSKLAQDSPERAVYFKLFQDAVKKGKAQHKRSQSER
eukprot:augustus_masked-scaffold_25-processed-gene-3.59-mRNA-1 protein AED:0.40 eAED:0.41 QI:0/-1/0/1/-1/1/1/0/362